MSFFSSLYDNIKKKEQEAQHSAGGFFNSLGRNAGKASDFVGHVADEALHGGHPYDHATQALPDNFKNNPLVKTLLSPLLLPQKGLALGYDLAVKEPLRLGAAAGESIADKAGFGAQDRTLGPTTGNQGIFKALLGDEPIKGGLTGELKAQVPDSVNGHKLSDNTKLAVGIPLGILNFAGGNKAKAAEEGVSVAAKAIEGLSKANNVKSALQVISKDKTLAKLPEEAKKLLADRTSSVTDLGSIKREIDNAVTTIKPSMSISGDPEPVRNATSEIINKVNSKSDELASPQFNKVTESLTGANAAKIKPTKGLENMQGTIDVLGKHFGSVGTDFGYKLSQGASKFHQAQQDLDPLLSSIEKGVSKIAGKSSFARKDLTTRVLQALEDRPNAANYLKNPKEQEVFDNVQKLFDTFKHVREAQGKAVVGENYSPRAALQDALSVPERLTRDIQGSFGTDLTSAFSKQRVPEAISKEIDNTDLAKLVRRYSSSQLKEFAYQPALSYFKEGFKNVDPTYLTNPEYTRKGEQYAGKLIKQVINPDQTTKAERFANKALQTTYKNQLGFSPRFMLQNFTQRWIAKAEVNGAGKAVYHHLDAETAKDLRKGLTSGDSSYFGDFSGLENSGVKAKGASKINLSNKIEQGNVNKSFDLGASQAVAESDAYKQAIKSGMKKKDAIKAALQDPVTKDLAIRRGNTIVNNTQFGANVVTRPEFFRQAGFIGHLPASFVKQYHRFSTGMIDNLSKLMNIKNARELDILKRGDPRQTPIVDFKKAAGALQNGTDELIKAIKTGAIKDVDIKDARLYKKTLDKQVAALDKEIKGLSQLRKGKTIKQFAKMWAASTAIQFMFSGGDQSDIGKSAVYGAPINVPTKADDVVGIAAPSLRNIQQNPLKTATNFIPGVGLVVNRANDVKHLAKTIKHLTGE